MSEKTFPKVLVIGHNVFCESTAFGKTLCGFFKWWDKNKIAELYFHSEIPTAPVCENYFRITDTDVLKSIFTFNRKNVGTEFHGVFKKTQSGSPRTDTGFKKKVYEFSRRRTSSIYIARNLMWKMSGWYSKRLKAWLDEFNPEVIFFATGDYSFAYKIASRISKDRNIPIVSYCCDDYYINRLNPKSLLSKPVYRNLMKNVKKCMSLSASVITICKEMTEEYKKLFNKRTVTLYTGYSCKNQLQSCHENAISYLGNLGFDRYQSLVEIGNAVKGLKWADGTPVVIDVYSTESRQHIVEHLTLENGIDFHGAVTQQQVNEIIKRSFLVIHTESFFDENIKKVKYSISTKIADLLASGTCILAYGPLDIASIKYLKENDVAYAITQKEELRNKMKYIIENPSLVKDIPLKAMALADKNHSPAFVTSIIYNEVCRAVKERDNNENSIY